MRSVRKEDLSMKISSESEKDKAIFTCAPLSDTAYISGLVAGSKAAFSYKGKALFGYLHTDWLWVVLSSDVPNGFWKELAGSMKSALAVKGSLMYMTISDHPFLEKEPFRAMGWRKEYEMEVNGHTWKKWRCDYASHRTG